MQNKIFYLILLLVLCYILLFSGLGDYNLIDIDETRYISIAKNMYQNGDFVTPVLNFAPFLEKPPMFYWLTVISYKLTGGFSNFASRLPVAFIAFLGIIGTFAFVRFVSKSTRAAFLSSVILLCSFWYAVLAHIAILDSAFAVFTSFAFYCGVSTLFLKSENLKKLFWYSGYIFLALSLLQKGLIGIIIPCASLFFVFLAKKRVKEIFNPSYFVFGIIIFLLISFPWHYLIFKANGSVWLHEYILKHHFARFINSSMNIGRDKPFFFYVPVILGGFLPWTFFLLAPCIKYFKRVESFFTNVSSNNAPFYNLILINIIWFLTIFIFFSVSSTKLPTYILPLFPSIAVLTGCFWDNYFSCRANEKYIKISLIFTFILFFSAGLFGLWYYFSGHINIGLNLAFSFILISVFGLLALLFDKKILHFFSVAAFSFSLFGFSQAEIFNFVTSFGQNELEEFSKIVPQDKNTALVTFGFARKYSMMINYNKKPVYFISNGKNKNSALEKTLFELKGNTIYLVVRNNLKENSKELLKDFVLIKEGKKYSLLKKSLL